MTEHSAKRNLNRCPAHPPSALLREDMLPASGRRGLKLPACSAFGGSIFMTSCGQEAAVAWVAVRVGKLFGGGAGIWVRMQAACDTWHAERDVDVSDIPTLKVA